MSCGSTARNGCATKTKSESQWHRQSCLCLSWLAAAQPGMAVPQKPNLRASGTGNLACACRGLRQHSQEWLCHKNLWAQDSVLIQQGAPVDWESQVRLK